jgi:hypothetical protein
MWRAAIAVLLVMPILAACGSSETSRSSSSAKTPAATLPRCARLRTSYVGTEGATGHLEVTLALRNVSSTTCHVRGYPGVTLMTASGRDLAMKVTRGHGFFPDTMRPPRDVVLKPGGRVRFGLSFVTNREYAGAHTCRTASSVVAGMSGWSYRVALPRGPRIAPCGRQLVVSPVYA